VEIFTFLFTDIEGHAWRATEHVLVRIGIHTGAAAKTATGLVGLDVHRAARLAAVAYGGQILVSETTALLVRDTLPSGAALRDLGPHRLKDLGRPERIYQLEAADLRTDFPPLRTLGNPALPNNLPAQLATFIGRDRERSGTPTRWRRPSPPRWGWPGCRVSLLWRACSKPWPSSTS